MSMTTKAGITLPSKVIFIFVILLIDLVVILVDLVVIIVIFVAIKPNFFLVK